MKTPRATGPRTRTGTSTATAVRVRGHDLVNELIGHVSYARMLFLLLCGSLPNDTQERVLDACLVTLMEHGLTPSAVITRLMADSVPEEPQVAIASGLLAIGSVYAGSTETCALLLQRLVASEAAGDHAAIERTAREHARQRLPVPGFGHGTHKPDDPRAVRLVRFAKELGCEGLHLRMLQALSAAVDEAFGRHITINATGAMAALLLDADIPVAALRGISVAARAGGLVGHLLEEREDPSGRAIWHAARLAVPYEE